MGIAATYFLVVHTADGTSGSARTHRASCGLIRAQRGDRLGALPLPSTIAGELDPALRIDRVSYQARASKGALEVETIIWAAG